MQLTNAAPEEPSFKPVQFTVKIESEEELDAMMKFSARTISFPSIVAGGPNTVRPPPEIETSATYIHCREFMSKLHSFLTNTQESETN